MPSLMPLYLSSDKYFNGQRGAFNPVNFTLISLMQAYISPASAALRQNAPTVKDLKCFSVSLSLASFIPIDLPIKILLIIVGAVSLFN